MIDEVPWPVAVLVFAVPLAFVALVVIVVEWVVA
jgi:hypothetical protein